MKLLQLGNSKLGKDILMFNIPADITICGRKCPGCYSYKAYKIYPNVLPAQQKRYRTSLQENFVDLIISELQVLLKRKMYKYIRWHASAGEFYSQDYINKVIAIAKAFPSLTFYAYTKRTKDFNFSALSSLPNFILIDSFHFGGLNYGPLSSAPIGAFVCPHSTTVECGNHCTYCMTKLAQSNGVYFKQH